MTTTHPSANDSGLNLDHIEALTDEQYQEVLRPVLSRYGMQRFLNGDEITLNPSDYRAIIERARATQPVAAPTAGNALDERALFDHARQLELVWRHDCPAEQVAWRAWKARAALANRPAPLDVEQDASYIAGCRKMEDIGGSVVELRFITAQAAQAFMLAYHPCLSSNSAMHPNQPAPTVPATLPDAAALMYNALNDAYQSSVFDGEELRQVVRALAAYNRSRSGPAALAHQPAQERAERGQTLEAPLEAAPHISSAQQEPVAAPQQAPHGHLSGEQVFELAAPYFAWNASSWRESTQGTIVMTSLLGFADALLKAGPAPEQAEALEPDDAIGFRRWSKEPEMMESWVASQQAAAPDVERSVEYIMSAVASYADTKEASTLERIRRMVAEGEQARTVQQAAAPGALAIEAAKLAPILRSMCEGGDVHGEGVDIYADEYIAGDGDTYVVRAAALLEQVAAAPAGPFINEGTSAPGTPEAPQTAAARDVLAERQRQVEQEGWTLERDDQYVDGQLASAAIAYVQVYTPYLVPHSWPWSTHWFKPADDRRNLVKAGALLLAEIERLDRAAQLDGGQEGSGHASS